MPTIDVDALLGAIVLGGQALAREQGGRKVRRRVPAKQERLVRLVAKTGSAGHAELAQEFKREWETIQRRRKGEYALLVRREFFRNMADLAGRINAGLLAAYRARSDNHILHQLGGQSWGLAVDQQTFTITLVAANTLTALEEHIQGATGSGHVALRTATTKAASPASVTAGQPPDAPGPDSQKPPAPKPSQRVPTPKQDDPTEQSTPIEVSEDPITGRWTFTLQGQHVEVDPRLGYLRTNGAPQQLDVLRGLAHPEDLAGEPLETIRKLLDNE